MWQDFVLTGGTVVFIIALIPSVIGRDKPAMVTSIATGSVLAVFAIVYATLGLWFSTLTTSLTSLTWFILAIQKYLDYKRSK